MKIKEYQESAAATANSTLGTMRPVVACMGLAGEAGEFVDEYKKVVGHGHPIDEAKLKKELGDVAWYIAELCTAHGWCMDEVLSANIQKLKTRYPEKFTTEASINRVDVDHNSES